MINYLYMNNKVIFFHNLRFSLFFFIVLKLLLAFYRWLISCSYNYLITFMQTVQFIKIIRNRLLRRNEIDFSRIEFLLIILPYDFKVMLAIMTLKKFMSFAIKHIRNIRIAWQSNSNWLGILFDLRIRLIINW